MAPSAHRMPPNQSVDVILSAGLHVLVAVIARPVEDKEIERVVGLTDYEDNDLWIPHAFQH